ncbi:MAG: family N-acetyltransferase [Frankiales bacterium]|nr:family N-acetyltransferase [Frankiales bacterium]
MPPLDLDDHRKSGLAATLEEAARALAAVRYGAAFRFGLAHVVLNPDNPLATGSFASGLEGDLGTVERTLLALPLVWREAGRHQVVLVSSPSSAPELDLLAEECGYEAAEETTTMLLTDPRQLVEGEPGILVRPLPEDDEPLVGALMARAHDWSTTVGRRLQVVQGHRLDDPRHLAMGAWENGTLAGVATGFLHGAAGQVALVAVDKSARRHRLGRALVSGVAATLLQRGARLVWLSTEAGGITERFFAGLGFEPAYDAVVFTQPVD